MTATLTLPSSPTAEPGTAPPTVILRKRGLGPLLLYFLIALGMLIPYRTNAVRPWGDLPVVMAITLQADHALREGQFPIRVAPEFQDSQRYPAFQFYGNLPYTVTGALSILLHNPYTAWKIACLGCLVCAGYFTMRLSEWLCGSDRASVLAGAVFLCAPYLMTDLNARGAFAEMAAFCLMPAAFYATLRCLESAQRRRILWCALAWTLIGLTHNISYLYGVLFAGLFCLPFLLGRRRGPRILRLGAAGLIHATLMLWYVVPQFRMMKLLAIKAHSGPFEYSVLSPLHILLAPVLTNTPDGIGTPNLGLQVGWPILGGVFLALIGFILPRRTPAPRRLMTALLLGSLAVSFFMAWSPVDFWRFLPRTLWFVQFPYRLLLFVVLFGSCLVACGLARLFPRRMPLWAMLLVLGGIGIAVASYIPRNPDHRPDFAAWLDQHPDVNGMNEYLPSESALAATNVSDADPRNHDWQVRLSEIDARPSRNRLPRVGVPTSQVRYGAKTRIDFVADHPLWLEMPVLDYPSLLNVRDNGHRIPYQNAGRFITVRLGRGLHKIAIAFVGIKWANIVSLVGWIAVLFGLLLPLFQRVASQIGMALAPSAGSALFSAREALVGFVVLLGSAVAALYPPVRAWLTDPPGMRLRASPSIWGPENAFDDNPTTAWVAADSKPATLNVEFSRHATLHGLILEPRITSLNECWQHLALTLFKDGRQVYNADFDFPGAASDARETILFPAVSVDRAEMRFSQPVLTTLDGGHVTAGQVEPGYREIRFLWGYWR